MFRWFLIVVLGWIGTGFVRADTSFYFDMSKLPGAEVWVARHEVTQAQYLEITGENPSRFGGADHPVENVSWDDAVEFCARLTARERAAKRLPSNLAYDLPTDEQWDTFAVGTDLRAAATSLSALRTETEAVGAHAANPLGLYDVVGNVWEWCRDWYDNRIRKNDANKDVPALPSDAEAAASGLETTFKVLRGGAWNTAAPDGFTLATRLRYAPGMSNAHTGFRCVVVVVSPAQSPAHSS